MSDKKADKLNMDMDTIEGTLNQIISIANKFENKRLPPEIVGAIEGWCQRALRLARAGETGET